ncbi:HAD family hydrolase [Pandoraea pneumonica]|uniref:HAD family hydrolase n=1 Tax=Pandoraea pneumonica TaxID=2508299 RepID=A0A5E4TT34_9BURK|nr:HAD family phosphatase [Pandoraea pneumonica]VVD90372.1 HAD family hydrolase [Pandoraea pneumonica]
MNPPLPSNASHEVDAIVFDLGNVLIRWDPRNLYRKIFGSDVAAMEQFLADVCNTEWNEQQDCGRPWKDAIDDAVARHPKHEANIRAYFERWSEMIPGDIAGTVDILKQLRSLDIRLLALTNWSAETFPIAQERFPFLGWFEGIVVSGRERMMKPDPAIFRLLIERHQLRPATTAFIDDSLRNVHAADHEGLLGIHFTSPDNLRTQLKALGVPLSEAA